MGARGGGDLPHNAPDHLPRKADDDCLTELRWLYDLRSASEAHLHLRAWLEK